MSTSTPPMLTLEEVMADLDYGRTDATRVPERLGTLGSLPRPVLGGARSRWTFLRAVGLGRLHPRLARRALLELWFTPWVHPSVHRIVEDPSGAFVAWSHGVDAGSTLRGYTGGSGPTVVLVHGWAGRGADWRHLAADLVHAGWRVVVPDLPAHGRTPGRRTDLLQIGRALASVLDHERPTTVITHSMGFPATMVALEAGAPEPARIVAISPGRRMSRALDAFGRQARLPRRLVDELRRGIEARYGADIWEVLDVDRVVPDLTASGVVIHDLDDEDVPTEDARAIADRWSGAELVVTAGLGHRRILRDEAVREQVVGFLDDGRDAGTAV